MTTRVTSWSTAEDDYIRRHVGKASFRDIGRVLNKTRNQVRGRWLTLQGGATTSHAPKGQGHKGVVEGTRTGEEMERDISANAQVLTTKSRTIRTLEDALAEAKIDLNVWEVERHVVNKWDCVAKVRTSDGEHAKEALTATELWQVKVWLRAKKPSRDQLVVEDLIKEMQRHAPRYVPVKYPAPPKGVGEQLMYEISIPDLHLGKLGWGREVGIDYDVRIAERLALSATEELLDRVHGLPISCFCVPVGNDLLHVDNASNQTVNGTPQDADTRWHASFLRASKLIVTMADRLRQIAPVKIVVVPGNHDRTLNFCLGHAIDCWYHNDEQVTVDNGPAGRKYVRFGNTLLGFTHGDEEKHESLPGLMMRERPQDMADIIKAGGTAEWHLGHFHKKKETRFNAGDTHGGIGVKILPSLSGTDAWHFRKGYVHGPHAAEGYLWGFDSGYRGHFSASFPDSAYRDATTSLGKK